MNDINFLIKKLKLKGYWSKDFLHEFYTSEVSLPKEALSDEYNGNRKLFNWAYYLMPKGCICPFHKLYSEESWQFCVGGPMKLMIIEEKNKITEVIIGPDFRKKQNFIYIIPKNKWFAAFPLRGVEYTLITHCVSPGWVKQDDIPGYHEDIIKMIPNHKTLANKLSWPYKTSSNL